MKKNESLANNLQKKRIRTIPINLLCWCIMNGEHSPALYHDSYIRWLVRNRCTLKKLPLLFDLFKVIDKIESSHNSVFSP